MAKTVADPRVLQVSVSLNFFSVSLTLRTKKLKLLSIFETFEPSPVLRIMPEATQVEHLIVPRLWVSYWGQCYKTFLCVICKFL
jgi:hypothetical protein